MNYFVKPVDQQGFDSFSIHQLSHNYHQHPMLQLDAIEKLAESLMEHGKCRFAGAKLALDSKFHHVGEHPEGKTLQQVFAELESPESWVALYNIETNPDYKKFLFEVIEGVRPEIEKEQGRIMDVQGFMFISSPPSVTPFHIDRENNFWIQLKGRKLMTVFDNSDREIIPAQVVENFILRKSLKEVRLEQGFVEKGHAFDVAPGDGVYFPSTSPHMTQTDTEWVTPGDGVSVSLGIVFYTDFTRKQARIHQFNHLLRKLGITPRPVPTRPPLNSLKGMLGYLYALVRKLLLGYKPPPGAM